MVRFGVAATAIISLVIVIRALRAPALTPMVVEREVMDEAAVPARNPPRLEPWLGVLVRPSSEVMSLQEGTVQRVHVRLGDRVEKGQLLVTLEPTAAQAALATQRGSAEVAQAEQVLAEIEQRQASEREARAQEVQRFLNVEEASASSYAARSANIRLRAAIGRANERQGALAAARLQLRQTELRAPISGRVSECFLEEGSTATMGRRLMRIVSDQPPRLRFAVPATALELVALETRLQVFIPSMNRTLQAEVDALAPRVDPLTGMWLVEAGCRCAADLPSGLAANVSLAPGSR